MKTTSVPRDALRQIQLKAKAQFGLSAVSSRPVDLYRKLVWIAKQQHIEDIDNWLRMLAQQPWTDSLREQVIPAFTIGETYFRRDPNASAWLAQKFLPQLLAQRQQQHRRRLDCWSAGCCTGEEAYGLLFLINELQPADFSINIVATDLNPDFLQRAKAGRYRQGSFRSADPDFQQRYFRIEDNDWVLLEQWRNRIQFEVLNLIDCEPPRGQAPFDLILCRNVLMYFSQSDACEIIHMYMSNLRADGVLLLGAVDASLAASAGYQGFWAGDNYAIWGSAEAHQQLQSDAVGLDADVDANHPITLATPKVRPLSKATLTALSSQKPSVAKPSEHNRPLSSKAKPKLADFYVQLENPRLSRLEKAMICWQLAKQLQRMNRLEEALSWLTEAASIQPLNARGQLLLGQHYLFTQQATLAAEALQKALYLDANNIAAHFYYAQACQQSGRASLAVKSLQYCLKLIHTSDSTKIIDDTDGLSVGHLQKLAEQLIHAGGAHAN